MYARNLMKKFKNNTSSGKPFQMTIILAPSTKTKFVFAFGKLKFAFEFAFETVQVFKMSLLITMSLLIKCCSKTHDQKQIAKKIVPRRGSPARNVYLGNLFFIVCFGTTF